MRNFDKTSEEEGAEYDWELSPALLLEVALFYREKTCR